MNNEWHNIWIKVLSTPIIKKLTQKLTGIMLYMTWVSTIQVKSAYKIFLWEKLSNSTLIPSYFKEQLKLAPWITFFKRHLSIQGSARHWWRTRTHEGSWKCREPSRRVSYCGWCSHSLQGVWTHQWQQHQVSASKLILNRFFPRNQIKRLMSHDYVLFHWHNSYR